MPNDDEDEEDVARLGSGVLFLCSLAPAAVAEAEMEEEEDHITYLSAIWCGCSFSVGRRLRCFIAGLL